MHQGQVRPTTPSSPTAPPTLRRPRDALPQENPTAELLRVERGVYHVKAMHLVYIDHHARGNWYTMVHFTHSHSGMRVVPAARSGSKPCGIESAFGNSPAKKLGLS